MNLRRMVILSVGAISAFAVGYGAVAQAWPTPYNTGYFTGAYDTAGTNIMQPDSDTPGCAASGGNSLPTYIDTAAEFVAFMKCRLTSTNSSGVWRQMERTGAAFIIQTMIGNTGSKITSVSDPRVAEWESRVYYYELNGWIVWNWSGFGYAINTYYQGSRSSNSPDDDAWYGNNGSALSLVFTNSFGGTYVIRRPCFNPVGGLNALTDPPSFTMSGTSSRNKATVAPGDTVQFTHSLTSTGATSPTTIAWTTQNTQNGNSTVTTGNAGTFTAGQTKTPVAGSTENYIVPIGTPPGTQICRRISFTPVNSSGGTGASPPACSTVTANYNLTPSISISINGSSTGTNEAEPGDTVAFTYTVNNSANGDSSGTACTIYGLSRNGYYTVPSPVDTTSDGGYSQPAHGCPRDFPGNSSTIIVPSESVAPALVVANKSICRTLVVSPASAGGSPASTEVCVYITSKPYTRVYGGDVIAGGGVETAPGVCTTSSGAAIIGWNKGSATFGGAGVQFAGYALSRIFEFASASTGSGPAAAPTGLSFGNTSTSVAGGNYGGSLGSVPCIPNHFATKPSTTLAIPANVSTMTTGSYSGVGNISLAGGTVDSAERISVYVDGNLFISSNITYGGSWTSGNIPMLRVIVRGNIFIDNDVSQLDGLYIAQPNGASGGAIYTCALNADPFTPMALDGSLATQCDNARLTVNGGFVAKQVRLMRTVGTKGQASGSGEPSSSANIAEVFNYNPAMWIAQPPLTGGAGAYDAITTLPPVL